MRTSKRSHVIAIALLMGSIAPLPQSLQAQESLVDPMVYRGLAADHRAFRVGDVVTVYVQETTSAKAQAATDAASNLDMEIGLRSPSTNYSAGLGLGGANGAGARTTREGQVRAQISAQVTAVEPNGMLHIEGAQGLTVNGENQTIRVSGLVRPEDVSAENAVWSHRIANAELELSGVGVVSESQRQSLIYRLFKWLRLM